MAFSWREVPPRTVSATPLLLIALLAISGGCASGGGGGTATGGNPDRITALQVEELRDQYRDAYEMVSRVRPQWLRARTNMPGGPPGGEMPVVYLDGSRLGPVTELQRINMSQVESLQYMSATDATTRYGTGHAGGVILVSSRR